jgi:hypothetical protein
MNETKVNTNSAAATQADVKKVTVPGKEYVGSIETPYGCQLIERNSAGDQAIMRARQAGALFRLMMTESGGAQRFSRLHDNDQDSLLWLGSQIADELAALVRIVIADEKRA